MTNSKNNEKPEEIIHANLALRSRTKKSIFVREKGKKRNFKNFGPPEGAFESVSKVLTDLGFKVIGKGRFSLIISSSKKLFEDIFKVQLKKRRYALFAGSTRPRANYFTPITEIKIPEVLMDFVEKVTFSPPFRYFQSAVPPNPNYHHLNVPDQITELLKANVPHNLGYTGRGVHVVMIDTGFYNHPYYSDKGYSINVESIDGDTAEDKEGHGTAIAANLFAVAPEIDFTMIKAISEDGDLNDVIAALYKAIHMHFWIKKVDIITCSWGTCEGLMEFDEFIDSRAIIEAEIEAVVDAGITVIFAVGNKKKYTQCFIGWPGTMLDVISVGGAYVHETLTDWEASSYASSGHSILYSSVTGPRKVPDVCGIVGQAPNGVLIVLPTEPSSKVDQALAGGTFPNGDETATDDGWVVASGTSSAAPMVAGVAALMIQKYRSEGRSFTPELIKFMLGLTARDITTGTSNCGKTASIGYDNATGHGLVDAEAAITEEPPVDCFIASAAYGNILAPEVQFLRFVRDAWTHRSLIGKRFLEGIEKIYYKFSPKVAEAMKCDSRLKKFVRLLIVVPIVKGLSFGVKIRHRLIFR